MKFCLSFLLVIFIASQLVYAGKDKKKDAEHAPKKHHGKPKQTSTQGDSVEPPTSSSTTETPVGLTMISFS